MQSLNLSPAFPFRADVGEVVVERDQDGRPHEGKTFAVVHAHLDDMPFYAAGLCAKLMREGYKGYLIRTSNDEKVGGGSSAENTLANEQDHYRLAEAMGFEDVFDLYYRNHRMDNISTVDIRGRLILLFRMLKVDTVLTFNPWGHGEENPDHAVTGKAAEEACWMCGMANDFHEHREAGIEPHPVRERYYFVARPGQPYNRVVDISSHLDAKIGALVECKTQGGGNLGAELRARLASQGKRLPLLGDSDEAANRAYVRQFLLSREREAGREHELEFAERFYYIDQRAPARSEVDDYVERNAVDL